MHSCQSLPLQIMSKFLTLSVSHYTLCVIEVMIERDDKGRFYDNQAI